MGLDAYDLRTVIFCCQLARTWQYFVIRERATLHIVYSNYGPWYLHILPHSEYVRVLIIGMYTSHTFLSGASYIELIIWLQ